MTSRASTIKTDGCYLFLPSGIKKRWTAGYEKTLKAIELAPWNGDFDPLEGVFLHEPKDETKPSISVSPFVPLEPAVILERYVMAPL